jgi:cell fate regulator YaaT (PSP1 superfamily)
MQTSSWQMEKRSSVKEQCMRTQAIRFDNGPKLYAMKTETEYAHNARVVVNSRRGPELATVRDIIRHTNESVGGEIVREATAEDLERWAELEGEANDLKWLLRSKARALNLRAKIVTAEFTLDGNNLTVSYSSEEKVELRGLMQELSTRTTAHVHFSAVGARDQARILGVLGVCGTENCSSHHLQEFTPVTIRMSRDQQLPLNPEKISGPCGRLLCCLQYEHEMYQELLRDLPRKGAKVCSTEDEAQCGKVMKINPLKQTVEVKSDEGQWFEIPQHQIKSLRGN